MQGILIQVVFSVFGLLEALGEFLADRDEVLPRMHTTGISAPRVLCPGIPKRYASNFILRVKPALAYWP
jgi:hypothetical protein